MTPDPDALATLRDVAEMIAGAAFKAMNSQPIGSQARIALSVLCYEVNEIATAPAVAKAGDAKPPAYPRCTRVLQANGVAYPRTCAECGLGPCKSSLVEVGIEPTPSPSDPFAQMVETAVKVIWPYAGSFDLTTRSSVRRAIAAAIEAAPYTTSLEAAFLNSTMVNPKEIWHVMTRALAAELRREK